MEAIQPLNQQQVLDKIEKFQNGILLWGGPEVLKAYLDYRVIAGGTGKNNSQLFPSIDRLHQAIREDIGLSNLGLENLDTVRLYLKNPSELDQLTEIASQSKSNLEVEGNASSPSA